MRWMVLVVALATLAGCLDDSSTDDVATGPAPDVDIGVPQEAEQAKEAAEEGEPLGDPHGEPETTSSDVEAKPQGTGWEARQTFTYVNGVGAALSADLGIAIGAGAIEVHAADVGSYEVTIELVATGPDEATARDALASMRIDHTDELSGDHLTIGWSVETPPYNAGGLPVSLGNVGRAAYVDAAMPAHLAYAVDLDAGSGDVATTGMAGPALDIDTGSGDIAVDGANHASIALHAGSGDIDVAGALSAELSVDTGSGDHSVEGSFDAIRAESGSGDQDYLVTARSSGSWSFNAGSGEVTVGVARADGQALDVKAQNGSGSIDIDLSDGEAVGDQDDDHAHVRSAGYANAPVQTSIDIETGSGDIAVADA